MWISKYKYDRLIERIEDLSECVKELQRSTHIAVDDDGRLHWSMARNEVRINEVVQELARHIGLVRDPGCGPSLVVAKKK